MNKGMEVRMKLAYMEIYDSLELGVLAWERFMEKGGAASKIMKK